MADRQFLERFARKLADQGKLIEAGWVGLRLAAVPLNAPAAQLREARMIFMAGAAHLFSSMMTMLDPGAEETEADLTRMDLISKELAAFEHELESWIAAEPTAAAPAAADLAPAGGLFNDRPVENPQLQEALDDVRLIMRAHSLAGAFMLISETEAAFAYQLHAPWSAIQPDAATPLGFRFRVNSAEMGAAEAKRRMDGGMHTVCQLADFGAQTMDWMEQLKAMLRAAGVDFTHTPYDGKPLPHLRTAPPR